jgi:hypothetical protein
MLIPAKVRFPALAFPPPVIACEIIAYLFPFPFFFSFFSSPPALDTILAVVNLFESRESFTSQLQLSIADRLVNSEAFDVQVEVCQSCQSFVGIFSELFLAIL